MSERSEIPCPVPHCRRRRRIPVFEWQSKGDYPCACGMAWVSLSWLTGGERRVPVLTGAPEPVPEGKSRKRKPWESADA